MYQLTPFVMLLFYKGFQLDRYICIFILYVCIFIKLHITAQSGPVILVILYHSH